MAHSRKYLTPPRFNRRLARRLGCSKTAPSQIQEAVFSNCVLGHCRSQLQRPCLVIFVLRLQHASFLSWCGVRANPSTNTALAYSRLRPPPASVAWMQRSEVPDSLARGGWVERVERSETHRSANRHTQPNFQGRNQVYAQPRMMGYGLAAYSHLRRPTRLPPPAFARSLR